jgi:hypothetical protein
MTTSPAAMTPAELDSTLAPLWERIQMLEASIANDLAWIERNPNSPRLDDFYAHLASLRTEVSNLKFEAQPFEAEVASRWAKNGAWNRYFLVKNANGHVHRNTSCSTCFVDTQYAWLPSLSDCDEDARIEEWGERACTVCFPSAPVNPFYSRPARIDREAQAARQAEAAKRQAAKDEKAITDLDGQPLKVKGVYGVIKTKVAARNELSGAIQSLAWYGPGHPTRFQDIARKLIPVLEAAGIDTTKVIANALKKVKDATYVGQVETLLAGEAPAETIEDGLDVRLQPALETIAKVEVKDTVLHGRTYGQSLTATFGGGARDAALDVLGLADLETDPGIQVLLQELARRLFSHAA